MATISAAFTTYVIPPPPAISLDRPFANPQPLWGAGKPLAATLTGDPLAELYRAIYYPTRETHPNQISAEGAVSFTDLYYNRIHVTPPLFEAGNVSTTVSYQVEVWNSFFTSKILTTLAKQDAEGINVLNGIAEGGTFASLQNAIYDIEVTPEGPTTIDALIRWTFGTDYGEHSITGNRLVLFPFRPAGPITETLQWLTNVIRSHSSEQRIALRRHPRQIWGMKYKQWDQIQSRMNSAMWGRNFQAFGLPVWTDVTYVYSSISAGTQTIYLDTRYFDYRVDGLLVLLYRDDLTNEAKEIAEVYDDRLVLTRPLEQDFPDGALLMPVVICRPEGGIVREDIGNDVTISHIKFRAIENYAYEDTTAPDTYLGYEVLSTWNIRRSGGVKSAIVQEQTIVDNQTGPWDVFAHRAVPDEIVDWSWVADNPADRWATKMFLMRQRGRQKSFWVSSRRKDMELSTTVASSSSELTVYNMGQEYLELIGDNRHIEVVMKDGTVYRREVVGLVGTSVDKQTQVIEISAIFGVDIVPEDVLRISYLRLVRFDSDEAEIVHNLGIYSELTMPLTVVEQPTTP